MDREPNIPDAWVVVEIKDHVTGEGTRRVLAGWYGGYGGSDSWKMSSGITSEEDCGDYIDYHNYSGSIYRCYKTRRGMSSLTASVFRSYAKQNTEQVTISVEE